MVTFKEKWWHLEQNFLYQMPPFLKEVLFFREKSSLQEF
jgi:hypothetical protein